MLRKMYRKWASSNHDFSVETGMFLLPSLPPSLSSSPSSIFTFEEQVYQSLPPSFPSSLPPTVQETWGENGGGLRSVLLLLKGPLAYGWSKTEAGVHRLVRISPFDSAQRRHTTFAQVRVYIETVSMFAASLPPFLLLFWCVSLHWFLSPSLSLLFLPLYFPPFFSLISFLSLSCLSFLPSNPPFSPHILPTQYCPPHLGPSLPCLLPRCLSLLLLLVPVLLLPSRPHRPQRSQDRHLQVPLPSFLLTSSLPSSSHFSLHSLTILLSLPPSLLPSLLPFFQSSRCGWAAR